MKSKIISLLLLLAVVSFSNEIQIASIQLSAGEFDRQQTPVSVSLDGLTVNQDVGQFQMVKVSSGKRERIPSQVISGDNSRLYWVVDRIAANESFTYELVRTELQSDEAAIEVEVDEQKIVIQKDGKKLLQYNSATVFPPDGVDPIYKRSGFIHPLWSPSENVLTRIQPPDHYHHYGIWGPWTKTHIADREIDFWNLAKGHGTVRFAGLMSIIEGAAVSGFKVHQEHIDFGASGSDKMAMNEVLDVRAWNVASGAWMLDYTITLNCPTDTVMLDAYRYGGGIGFRAVESWTNKNVRVLTSENKTRKDADGSMARWCDVSGENEAGQRSGIVFMSHPNNRRHPEPMRIWPENANRGRGDMFFEFCPIRHDSWLLAPGQDNVLKYRMFVYDDSLDAQTAEQLWQDFANPPKIVLVP
jgi:hypothetical protein